MRPALHFTLATLLLLACREGNEAPSCPEGDAPYWQTITTPKALEVVDSLSTEDRAHFDGRHLWFWTGVSAVRWDPSTDEWEDVAGFEGVELYDDPFIRLIGGRLVVWGDRDAGDNPADDAPTGRAEGYFYDGSTGWQPVAAVPDELMYYRYSGAVSDDRRLYVFPEIGGSNPFFVGVYDITQDVWQRVETPFLAEEVYLQRSYSSHRWATAQGHLVLPTKTNEIWILAPETQEWRRLEPVVGGPQIRWLTAANERVFAWSLPDEAFEILLDPPGTKPLDLPTGLNGTPLEAGQRVAFMPSRQGWNVYEPSSDTFTAVGTECEPELSVTPDANFTVMTDYGLFVSGELDWGDGPTYELGTYPREARLLVFPDSKPLRQ